MIIKNFKSFLLINLFSLIEITLLQPINTYAFQTQSLADNKSGNVLKDNSELSQKRFEFKTADGKNGLCEGIFEHPVGNVTFNTNPADGRLDFGFQLSPSSRLLLGDTVSGFMIQAVINYYKVNPPYGPHINKPSNYDFHGSILPYNRLGSKGSFRLQTGDKVVFTWIVTGVGSRSRAAVVRAVSCTAV